MKHTLAFLKDLKQNNDRAWFEKSKPKYLQAKEEFEEVASAIIKHTTKIDPTLAGLEVKNCVFRIYKDVRFSKDKSPYKTNMGASINPGGKKSMIPGYYVHIEPGNSFLAGGCYMPMPDKLQAIRQEIDYNTNDFLKIINNKEFKTYFKELSPEDKLKTAPKGYPKDHPQVELLKLKSFIVVHNLSDKQVLDSSFPQYAAKVFKAMLPLNVFLRQVE